MDLNPTQTSYFCEDQIDEVNRNYLAFCSQYEQSTQHVLTQSQTDGSQYQDNEIGIESTEQPQQFDFQNAFVQFLEAVHSSESFDESDVIESENFNSQTDFEARTHAVIIQNPHLANTEYKPSIETYLECSQYFETIKTVPKKVAKNVSNQSGEIRFKIGPQVLMIVDILNISIDPMNSGPLSSERMLYGQKFRSVMFYGRCQPGGTKFTNNNENDSLSEENIRKKYIVDDGSAKIVVHTSQTTNSNCQGLKQAICNLKNDLNHAHTYGIPFLGIDHCNANTQKCKQMLEYSKSIMGLIDRNVLQNNVELSNGAKVCVEGAPFRNSRNNNVEIFAYRVYQDSGPDRQMELSYMNHVMYEYETKLFKFKITGERI